MTKTHGFAQYAHNDQFCPTQSAEHRKSRCKYTGRQGFLVTPKWGMRDIATSGQIQIVALPTALEHRTGAGGKFQAALLVHLPHSWRLGWWRKPSPTVAPRGGNRALRAAPQVVSLRISPHFRAFAGSARTGCRLRRWGIAAVSARSTRQDEAPRRARRRPQASPAFPP